MRSKMVITCGYADEQGMCIIGNYKRPNTAEYNACPVEKTLDELKVGAIISCGRRNGHPVRINGLEILAQVLKTE